MTRQCLLILLLVGLTCADENNHDRVIDQALSDEPKDSPEYDQEAFLGSQRAADFKSLSTEERLRRLGIIADKIDKDGDGKINAQELEEWILFTQTRYIAEDSERQFDTYDKDKDGKIHWDEYKQTSYGFLKEEDLKVDDEDQFSYSKMIARDERRWDVADTDGDRALTKEEFPHFLHPEEFPRMSDIVVKETLEDIDKNKDGFVDINEYIGDMYNEEEEGGEKPEWVDNEKKHFTELRDENHDGKLDLEEVKHWILPQSRVEHIKVESKHLIDEADDDQDEALSKEEILNHHDLFVGSQVTDFGEALARHDEF